MKNDYCSTDSYPYFRHRHFWGRRFLTEDEKKELHERRKEMKIMGMTQYKESLENELKGVTERLNELNKETD